MTALRFQKGWGGVWCVSVGVGVGGWNQTSLASLPGSMIIKFAHKRVSVFEIPGGKTVSGFMFLTTTQTLPTQACLVMVHQLANLR